ncbi:asparagine synthase-related protein [Kribbella sp. NPDC056951]|uniref:asparagine synthase-related protein n=1 Tax=Kribbella sp. NPDC056951 TaxID=3345978 RepID=UPI00362DDF32
MRYPADAAHVLVARTLQANADPVAHLDRFLARQLESVLQVRATGIELSGGLDSANVALAAADHTSRQLYSFGLIGQGLSAAPQMARRAAIVHELGLADIDLHAAGHLPFSGAAMEIPDRRHYADGDVYREAFDELRIQAAASGCEVMLTGFGGDELMSLRGSERSVPRRVIGRPSWLGARSVEALPTIEDNVAPAAPVAVPCLMAFAARHPSYLRHGLWPVAPLADPELLRFAESLPLQWRVGKHLLRLRLTRAGFGSEVTRPAVAESFSDTMELALRRHGLAMAREMLQGSILVDAGYVDECGLAGVVRCAERGGAVPDLLYDTLAVERGLRSMVGAGVRSAGGQY